MPANPRAASPGKILSPNIGNEQARRANTFHILCTPQYFVDAGLRATEIAAHNSMSAEQMAEQALIRRKKSRFKFLARIINNIGGILARKRH